MRRGRRAETGRGRGRHVLRAGVLAAVVVLVPLVQRGRLGNCGRQHNVTGRVNDGKRSECAGMKNDATVLTG